MPAEAGRGLNMQESFASIPSGGLRLHGILRRAEQQRASLVLCDPFAEEKKCAHRVLTELSRALVGAGITVLRFDYRGCGDSPGEFADFGPEAWLEDVIAAAAWLREQIGDVPLLIVGLRMGACLAAQAAEGIGARGILALAPIIDGREYWRELRRRVAIKALMTSGEAEQVREAERAEVFDLAGWPVPQAMRAQIEALAFPPTQPLPATLVVDIWVRDEPSPRMKAAVAGISGCRLVGLRMEPFWQRIGLVSAQPLIDVVLQNIGWLLESRRG